MRTRRRRTEMARREAADGVEGVRGEKREEVGYAGGRARCVIKTLIIQSITNAIIGGRADRKGKGFGNSGRTGRSEGG